MADDETSTDHPDLAGGRLPRRTAGRGTEASLRERVRAMRASRTWRLGRWPFLAFVGICLALLAGLGILYATVELPDDPPLRHSSTILDAHGEEIAVLRQEGLREPVALGDVAPEVVDALIAAEDRRFYEHGGVDPIGVARALVSNLRGDDLQGGSTITQQLVKNSYLDHERTTMRKLREAVLSVKLERRDDKDEILERYLNTVYFGRDTYGIEAAARVYFESSAADLELHEAALLVGLLRAPETADPARDPEAAEARRRTVLAAMVETASITEDEAAAANDTELGATELTRPATLTAGVAPHFVEWVRAEAIERFGSEAVYGGGLRIATTLDLAHQRAAEAAIAFALHEPGDPEAALVGLDASGAVRAYVGSRDFDELQVDLARGAAGGGSGRQPGSAFKPFVLGAALEHDIPLGTVYPAPAELELDLPGDPEGPYRVQNYDGAGYGEMDLIAATASSVNTVYVQLAQDVGVGEVVDLADRAGIASEMQPDASLALGTSETSPLELTGSYLTFARAGSRVEPWAIARVETADGEVLFDAGLPEGEQVIDEGVARAVTHALRSVVSGGTGAAAALDRPVAGKTGTTQGHGDAWFIGYTPEYAAGVWLGYPEGPAHPMSDVRGGPVTGGGLPAQIWAGFMHEALDGTEPGDFEAPPEELLRPGRAESAELPDPPEGEQQPPESPEPPGRPGNDEDDEDGEDDGDGGDRPGRRRGQR